MRDARGVVMKRRGPPNVPDPDGHPRPPASCAPPPPRLAVPIQLDENAGPMRRRRRRSAPASPRDSLSRRLRLRLDDAEEVGDSAGDPSAPPIAETSLAHPPGSSFAASSFAPSLIETSPSSPRLAAFSPSDFRVAAALGSGTFGRVHLATHVESDTLVAIKTLSKSEMIATRQVANVRGERDALARASACPFVTSYFGSAQDARCVHFVLEYVPGGELFSHLRRVGRFAPSETRFYAAEVTLALAYLHGLKTAYRDLKPENVLLDARGHCKLADFGFAKRVARGHSGRTYTVCGTPDYIAPEVIDRRGHGFAVDWWSLGVLVFELSVGWPPFRARTSEGTYDNILRKPPGFPPAVFGDESNASNASNASNVSNERSDPSEARGLRDLIARLLRKDAKRRLGFGPGGARDVASHPWFAAVDWRGAERREMTPPVVPTIASRADVRHFDAEETHRPLEHLFELTEEEQELFEDV